MAKQYPRILPEHRDFIARQRIFFAASAAAGSRVNLSPREGAALRVLDDRAVCWLDRTGSGAETAAHIRAGGRVTVMWCAFEGPPLILRVYGSGESLRRGTPEYAALRAVHYPEEPVGARQIIRVTVDLVQTSCGYGVPVFTHRGDRPNLDRWAEAKGEAGLVAYRAEKNARSIDGLETGLIPE